MIETLPRWNLHITSDGTAEGTTVHVGETLLQGVTSISWKIVGPREMPEAIITCYPGILDVTIPIDADLSKMKRTVFESFGHNEIAAIVRDLLSADELRTAYWDRRIYDFAASYNGEKTKDAVISAWRQACA